MAAGAGPARFSTGIASPVSADWLRNRSLVVSSRTSAGTMSPAPSRITSPGTSPPSGISCSWPARTTVAVLLTIACSRAAALSARISCTKRNTTPSTTITSTTTADRRSPVSQETRPRTSSRMMRGLRTLSKRSSGFERRFVRAIWFGPYWISRAATSASLSPSARDSSRASTVASSQRARSSSAAVIAACFPS